MHNFISRQNKCRFINKQALGYQLLISKIAQYVSSPDTKCSLPRGNDDNYI